MVADRRGAVDAFVHRGFHGQYVEALENTVDANRCGSGKMTEPPHYNQIAGHSVERLAALSDGIFGVAMTLLLLGLRPPAREVIHSDLGVARELPAMYRCCS